MSTHNAIAITKLGTIDQIQVLSSAPGASEVLIKVEYTSLVVFDTYMTDLGYFVQSYPVIPGLNASGTVVKLGEGVTDLAVGDRLCQVAECALLRPVLRGHKSSCTVHALAKIVKPIGKAAILMPMKKSNTLIVKQASDFTSKFPENNGPFDPTVKTLAVFSFTFLQDPFLRVNLAPKIIPSLLETGLIKPNRLRLIDQGTFKEHLDLLRNSKVSEEKVVVKVGAWIGALMVTAS